MNHGWIDSFWSSGYAPHGYCLLWRPDLIATHLISDVLIALAYFSIPIAIVRFVRKREDLRFDAIFWLFALFILACGMTHVMSVWNLWHGNYGLEGVVKAITAAASVPTAILLWRILPQALAIPSQRQLEESNKHLSNLVMERDLAVRRMEQEIADRRRTEAALVQVQKVDAIGQLTGGIAHDFNNLLQAASGNLELIRRAIGSTDERLVRWADSSLKAVERGSRLAKQLLVFSRSQRMEMSVIDVNAIIAGMDELVRRSLGPSIQIDYRLSVRALPVRTEPHQFEMMILNLAINARDAMPEGGHLTITTNLTVDRLPVTDPLNRPHVEIMISDSGRGMSPDVLAKAPDPFFTTKEVGKGTGLGLSMAYGLVRQSQGAIELHSELGTGTDVRIVMPLADEVEEDAAARSADPNSALLAKTVSAGTAIVVDDDEDVRPIIAEMLGELGYSVMTFDRPTSYLEANLNADIVLIDFMMPEMDGASLAKTVRERHPGQRILFISGYSESAAIDAVADDRMRMLLKPFSSDELAAAVEQLVSH